MSRPLTVLVTGATGRTGALVLEKLLKRPDLFAARGFARSPRKVEERFGVTRHFRLGDIKNPADLAQALEGCQALVILTSATPVMQAPPSPGQPPEFTYPEGEWPEQVDYQGQVNQIEAAKVAGVRHIVLVGSLGGTNDQHPLNKMGQGNILIWKRKAEQHLIASGIDYTIVRAGGLLDAPGGQRELLVGRDDQLLNQPPEGVRPAIPRADLAEMVVQALLSGSARNKAFDVISKPEDAPNARVTKDFEALFAQTTPGL
jgi:uncharacterized protein YbjT (DUF2867 family)